MISDACFQTLERHELRRRQGIPTLSALAGPQERCMAAWMEWAAAAKRRVCLEEWPAQGANGGGGQGSEFPQPLEEKEATVLKAALVILTAGDSNGSKAGGGEYSQRLAAAVDHLAGRLEALGERQASLALALLVDPEEAEAFLRAAPECRAKAFFREGLVVFPASAAERGEKADPEKAPMARTAIALAHWGVKPQTAELFQQAALAWKEARSAPADEKEAAAQDLARSAAERFLFELLGEAPETKGCFALNAKMDFRFGVKLAEVDLLAGELRLAVEIDGYRHFQDAAAYRRDRRKDALLQKQGYLVLRFRAEDVVTRMEEILEEIRAAAAFRRVTLGKNLPANNPGS
jgi:hypothetical protein